MERVDSQNDREHIIDIRSNSEVSSSGSSHDINGLDTLQREERFSTSVRAPIFQNSVSSANGSNSRNSSSIRRGDGHNRRRRSPLNSELWISIELILTVSQIVAAIVVLCLARHEHPRAPLFQWVVGYACGCVAILPLLYWRWHYRSQASEPDSSQPRQNSIQSNPSASFSTLSVTRTSDAEGRHTATASSGAQTVRIPNPRLKILMEYFKMALDCFFAVWFVVGNVWIFGGHSSPSEAPNLYRLCIVFLIFSCIGYAMPFILCATICCCLPCIISVLGIREDLTQNRGATPESINSLPTYKFKIKKTRNVNGREINLGACEGGVVAAGTEKERVISGEDAVCCICLAKYANNDDLRELLCSHFFHKECVDKWLKINALCPLCKGEVGESILSSLSGANSSLQRGEVGPDNGLAATVF
ncbi:E3 ubiquitin-protein ligase At1g63170 [Actinidia eriantha]|uniref:E3 ubiquitin-protein ligase At1g63170 n=1 Tax=Actinidia eriantha TaxID=165200 RepID=UPI00258B9FEA|nr:E3 ubiquitin-protein ligase At1g63170 [Actinidia eriantha]XP_057494085.1 E3 ubiquitin-protein ligase At1g63170 [Actinidia eriantha]XP_057494086.1 E3 ubiquitin-protein ligase At1g63170 [Actinidia eriantha]XP_057494087.1 E3 ubiquitin-protein ligase At1g63170 [Actinidia eriantha]XP_057494088.1 E3 ubiquitin-protein ligase At1g63170 [Actinidia eriantha]XP_057494089.1 E3 ubiquitin-protein ligase At1g63170 [Actinidia eriantha]